jgi:hypothetical protein
MNSAHERREGEASALSPASATDPKESRCPEATGTGTLLQHGYRQSAKRVHWHPHCPGKVDPIWTSGDPPHYSSKLVRIALLKEFLDTLSPGS